MRATRFAPVAAVIAAALLFAGCATPLVDSSGETPEAAPVEGHLQLPSTDELEAAVGRALDGTGVPGSLILITEPGGGSVLSAVGSADLAEPVGAGPADVPLTEDAVLAYRSITKAFVGTLILQLADEGKLSLDDSVSVYVDGVPGGEEITIQDLATMRSGVANYSSMPALGEMLMADPTKDPSAEEMLALAYPDSPVFEAGAAYEYSNSNTLLLGEVIEQIDGVPWFEAVQNRILNPLGLASVNEGFTGGSTVARGFQLADGSAAEVLPQVNPGWFGAAGALTGNITDLAAFGRALGDGSLLSAESQRARLDAFGPITDDPASPEYDAYGFAMGEIAGWVGHTGNGLGFQSLTMYDPESGAVIAILMNGTGEDGDVPAHVFREILSVLPPAAQ